MDLNHFIGTEQLSVLMDSCKGEEGPFFRDMLCTLLATIEAMPWTYQTDAQGDAAVATLHYFLGDSDWYIIEKDAGSQDDECPGVQVQAFGFACLNGDTENAELGYICIDELIKYGAEIDLYYKPEPLGTIKARFGR